MKIRSQLFLNNALILGILVAVSISSYRGSQSLTDSAEWVSHTQQVMANTREIAKLLVDMEAGQRGFMPTGAETFLEPYTIGNAGIDQTILETIQLVADNPLQVVRLQLVKTLHTQWLEDAGEYEIGLRRRMDRQEVGPNAIANVLQGLTETGETKPSGSKTGKDVMDEIRGVLRDIVDAEEALLATREAEAELAALGAERVALYGTIFAIVVALGVGLVVTRALMNQLGAEPAELKRVARRVASGVLSENMAFADADSENIASYVNGMIATFRRAARQADTIAGGALDLELEARAEQLKHQTASVERQRALLEEQTEELTLSNRHKSEFMSNMSHELRTPLNSMLILSAALAQNSEGNLTEKQVDAAAVVHSSGAELLSLINDILDLSKIDAGQMDFVLEGVELKTLGESLHAQFEPLATDKGISLDIVRDGAPARILTDEQRLRQVLKNLLSNAIKFTERGSVALRMEVATTNVAGSLSAADEVVALSVTDTGVGVPEEAHASIFEAFQQSDGTISRSHGGTGLGLTISRDLAKLLGVSSG
jgi:signal transduction histidine kinase